MYSAHGPGRDLNVPTPAEVVQRLGDFVKTSDFWSAIGETLWQGLMGLVCSIAVAVPLGLLVGSSKRATLSFQFVVDFLRTVPPVAVLPLMLLILGASFRMAVFLIMFGAVWPLFIQSTYAINQVSSQLKKLGRAYHLSAWDRVFTVYVPSALPFLMTGLRLAVTMSLLLAVTAGYFGGAPGIGRELQLSLYNSDTKSMFTYAIAIAIIGVVLNVGVLRLRRILIPWHPSVRGGGR